MKVTDLELQNIRGFANGKIPLGPRNWTVFVGENGSGKTSLMQVLALGLSGTDFVGHVQLDAATLVRQHLSEAWFEIELVGPKTQKPASSGGRALSGANGGGDTFFLDGERPNSTKLRSRFEARSDSTALKEEYNTGSTITEIRQSRARGWFACAIGPYRILPQPKDVFEGSDRSAFDRMESAFRRRYHYRSVRFYDRVREELGDAQAEKFASYLNEVLAANCGDEGLFPEKVRLLVNGERPRARQGVAGHQFRIESTGRSLVLAAHQLPDGYQSVIAWISEVLGQFAVDKKAVVRPENLKGVVLLDEIDAHLHPSWQRRIVPVLKKVFPKLQFIVTTHSPLILTGFKPDEIVRLQVGDDGLVHATPGDYPTALSTTSEILDVYFGVDRAARPSLMPAVRELNILLGYDTPTEAQRQRIAELETHLKREIGASES